MTEQHTLLFINDDGKCTLSKHLLYLLEYVIPIVFENAFPIAHNTSIREPGKKLQP
jgi:hypothetical protein